MYILVTVNLATQRIVEYFDKSHKKKLLISKNTNKLSSMDGEDMKSVYRYQWFIRFEMVYMVIYLSHGIITKRKRLVASFCQRFSMKNVKLFSGLNSCEKFLFLCSLAF